MPRRAAATASPASRSRAASRPPGPSAGSQVASSVRTVAPPLAHRTRAGPSRSTTIGRWRRSVRGAARRPTEQRRAPAELDPQVHDDPLALGVDRRVRDLREGLAEVVGDRPVEAAATGRRRVVAHAPQRLVALERHRLDVEPGALGVEAGEVAQDVVGRRRRRRATGRRRRRAIRSSYDRSGGVVDRAARGAPRPWPRRPRGSPAGPARPGAARPGPSRPRRTVSAALNGTAPASEATATSRSRVTAKAAGRSPLRSTSAPTRRPSAKTIAAGPSHGARKPAVRRRSVATCGCGARRSAERLGDRGQQGGGQGPAGRRQEFERLVERERVGAVRRTGAARRPAAPRAIAELRRVGRSAADLLAIAADRVDLAVVGDRAERLGEPPDRMRVRRVALVEDRVADARAARAGRGRDRAAGRR